MTESLPRSHGLRKNIEDDEVKTALSLKRHSDTRWSSRRGRRYIELKLSIPMAEIISTVMTCKYNRGRNYHTSL